MARAGVDDKMPFMEHLGELRVRIVRSLIAVLVGLVIAFPASSRIVDFLARPIKATGNTLVFLAVTEAFWVQMKVALFTGLFLAAPAILWQVWRFVAPGLHAHERKYAVPFVVIGSLMFVSGGAFSLFVVTPNAVAFLLSYSRPGLQPMISIGAYVDFLLKFTLAFGAVFEVPLGLTLAARMGLVTPKALARNRKYAILGAFIAAAILTPTPDMINQSLMAGPIILLYEIGIVSARLFGRRRPAPAAKAPAPEPSA
ncbi:MAG TPA: twin-arginine translocase subunit TatC [Methylomirabilota bacterium]|nr:twin-arginine translocase subunit TatC [Methylomirabilota bacterium]